MMSLRLPSIAASTPWWCSRSPRWPMPLPSLGATCAPRRWLPCGNAENDYNAIKKDLERRIADDGHPDKSELQALQDADAKRVMSASQAQRACGLL